MVFTNTWDAGFEAQPADSEDINLGANRIRAFKVAVRERMLIDHVWEDAQSDGKHNRLTLPPQVSAPATAAPDAFLFTMALGGVTELLYKDNNGNLMQLTSNGRLYPFATDDFSVSADLAVGGNVVVGETTSFGGDFIAGFAAFANPSGDAVLQFSSISGGTYLFREQATGQVHLVVNGVTVQTWP